MAVLESAPERIKEIFVQSDLGKGRSQRIRGLLDAGVASIRRVDESTLERMAGSKNHQGVVVVASPPRQLDENDALDVITATQNPLVLVLDGLEDPHNLGACLRTAEAAGVCLVVSGKSRGVGLTNAARRVAAGAADIVPYARVSNIARFLDSLRKSGLWVYGADQDAAAYVYDTDLSGPAALVMGAEGSGLRRLTREKCDGLVGLPMAGDVSSLNVSVAAGALLYEVVRQRRRLPETTA
jgi:23S rRNA (guanosine2251-2'-O)-methyltransferase